MAGHAASLAKARELLADWRWRLNNLYWITDKDGRRIPFRMNWAQEALYDGMHYLNVILKARQLGFTTFIQIFMLDASLFNSNVRCGTIAHTRDDATVIFRDKVKYPYDQLPDGIKAAVPIIKDSATELMLANNSSIRVGTSLRSGTLNYLHVSEYGKLCAKFPEKAREVRTGALNTLQAGQVAFIESTAEGQEGHFFDLCEEAQAQQRRGIELSELDFRFHFFPWWKAPEYQIAPDNIEIPSEMRRYFDRLALEERIVLSPAQMAWYSRKAATQLDDMKREYPSTPREAFEASVEGAILGPQMEAAEREGRIGAFPAVEGVPVHTAWDIGRRDYNPIWFFQMLPGPRVRVVHFYQNCLAEMAHYATYCERVYRERCWVRGEDIFPHDARVIEWGSGRSRIEMLKTAGFRARLGTELSLHDGINAVRATLPVCEFDAGECSEGIKLLKLYRWVWDEGLGAWRTGTPRHDEASHAADGFRTLGTSWREILPEPVKVTKPTALVFMASPDGRVTSNMSVRDIIAMRRRKRLDDE